MNWADWLKVIQLKPRFLFGIWVLGALLLFLPNAAALKFGISAFRDTYRVWIGLACLAAFVFWIVQLVPMLHQYWKGWKSKGDVIKSLETISQDEWLVLAYCLDRNQQTVTLMVTDRIVGSLMSKGLIIMGANWIGNKLAWPYTIPTHLWNHLSKKHELFMNRYNVDPVHLNYRFSELEAHMRRYDDF